MTQKNQDKMLEKSLFTKIVNPHDYYQTYIKKNINFA